MVTQRYLKWLYPMVYIIFLRGIIHLTAIRLSSNIITSFKPSPRGTGFSNLWLVTLSLYLLLVCWSVRNWPHVESSKDTGAFDLLRRIRTRRMQYIGHILLMGPDRKLKQSVFEIFSTPKPGDLLMDSPKVKSWRELTTYAQEDKEYSPDFYTCTPPPNP